VVDWPLFCCCCGCPPFCCCFPFWLMSKQSGFRSAQSVVCQRFWTAVNRTSFARAVHKLTELAPRLSLGLLITFYFSTRISSCWCLQ
jgi:hypothetical protein